MGGTGSYDPDRRLPGGTPTGDAATCYDLRFAATVQLPPNPVAVVSGDVLEVARASFDGVMVVAAFDAAGDLVGSIIDHLERLLPCLAEGVAFVAEVISVNHDVPSVRVMAAEISRVVGRASVEGSRPTTAEPDRRESVVLAGEETAGLPMTVLAGTAGPIEHQRLSELRALVRVGVSFEATLSSGTAVEIAVAT
jgi:hypothetical protein